MDLRCAALSFSGSLSGITRHPGQRLVRVYVRTSRIGPASGRNVLPRTDDNGAGLVFRQVLHGSVKRVVQQLPLVVPSEVRGFEAVPAHSRPDSLGDDPCGPPRFVVMQHARLPHFSHESPVVRGKPARYAQDIAHGLGAFIPPRVDAKRLGPGSDSRLRPRHRVPDRKTGNTPRTSREPWVRSSPCALNTGPARQLTAYRFPVTLRLSVVRSELEGERGASSPPGRSLAGVLVGNDGLD